MIRKFKRWLITSFLPDAATYTLEYEVSRLTEALRETEEKLLAERQEKERLESYINGLLKAMRSKTVNIVVKGGVQTDGGSWV